MMLGKSTIFSVLFAALLGLLRNCYLQSPLRPVAGPPIQNNRRILPRGTIEDRIVFSQPQPDAHGTRLTLVRGHGEGRQLPLRVPGWHSTPASLTRCLIEKKTF